MISIIVAIAQNGVIGDRGGLIWHLSEDLKHFKAITTGHPVIMGRKTCESLGRALPGRTNVVISKQPDYAVEGFKTAGSLEEAVALFGTDEEVFIIGGAQIYARALPMADRLYLTMVEADYEGDTHFPAWDPSQWRLTDEEHHDRGVHFDHPFTFRNYVRR